MWPAGRQLDHTDIKYYSSPYRARRLFTYDRAGTVQGGRSHVSGVCTNIAFDDFWRQGTGIQTAQQAWIQTCVNVNI
jgi:hypothetical protein